MVLACLAGRLEPYNIVAIPKLVASATWLATSLGKSGFLGIYTGTLALASVTKEACKASLSYYFFSGHFIF